MTTSITRNYLRLATVLLVMVSMGKLASAQSTQTELPSGEEILQKHIEATGGQAAYDKIKNRMIKSTLDITNAGIVLNVTIYAAKPNKIISTVESDATGKILKGCNGEVAWSMSDMQGPVVEQGAALENQLRDSYLDRLIYWKDVYQSAKCEGIEKVNGQDCYKVVFTPPPYKSEDLKDEELSLLTVYFDKETFLATKIESNVVTDAGTIDVTAYLSDYKEVDGIKIPHRTELELVGQKRVMEIQEIKHNVELKPNQFDPPAEIQKLLKKSKQKNG